MTRQRHAAALRWVRVAAIVLAVLVFLAFWAYMMALSVVPL